LFLLFIYVHIFCTVVLIYYIVFILFTIHLLCSRSFSTKTFIPSISGHFWWCLLFCPLLLTCTKWFSSISSLIQSVLFTLSGLIHNCSFLCCFSIFRGWILFYLKVRTCSPLKQLINKSNIYLIFILFHILTLGTLDPLTFYSIHALKSLSLSTNQFAAYRSVSTNQFAAYRSVTLCLGDLDNAISFSETQ